MGNIRKELENRLRVKFQSYFQNSTKEKMINRLEELSQDESKASFSLSRQAQDKLKEFDERIERLWYQLNNYNQNKWNK